jgi:hypothetical protein
LPPACDFRAEPSQLFGSIIRLEEGYVRGAIPIVTLFKLGLGFARPRRVTVGAFAHLANTGELVRTWVRGKAKRKVFSNLK